MEEQESLTPSQMLTLVQEMLVNNDRAVENLESVETEFNLSREKCQDNLNNHYDLVIKKLNEVYKSSVEEVTTQYDKKKEDLKRKEKYLTRCSLALMTELDNLRSSGPNAVNAVRRCEDILAKLNKVVDLQNTDRRVTFNFIPKIGKLKLGFLQLCNDLPQDFALRLLTPIMNIKLGQQIRCGIEGNFTAENVRHLEFGIRRNHDIVPTLNLGTEGDVFKFEFTADFGGVYVILACLYGTPIAQSPLTLTFHVSDCPSPTAGVLASHVEVSSNAIEYKVPEGNEEEYDEISVPVQEANSEKTSTKVVQGNEVKSAVGLEYSLARQQIKDDHSIDVNQNSKDMSKGKKNGINDEENSMIKETTIVAQARVNNNDLPGARFKVGDNCVALWKDGMWYNGLIEASNSDGSFHIYFVDYGNSGNIAVDDIVKSAPDIPEDVPDYDVDDNVGSRVAKKDVKDTKFRKKNNENDIEDSNKSGEDLDTNKNIDKSVKTKDADRDHLRSKESHVFQVGDVAKWSEDQVWYNGIVQTITKDGSYNVTFTDYGNTDYINDQFIVKDVSAIPPGEYVDANVNVPQIASKNLDRDENNETSDRASPAGKNVIWTEIETSKKILSAPGQATSSSQKAAVPFVMKTVIPQCDKFGDVGDKNNSKDSRANPDLERSLTNVKNERLMKRRNKSKPPVPRQLETNLVPRPVESNFSTKLNVAPMLSKTEEIKSNEKKDKINYAVGEMGIARWAKDNIWYNAKVENMNVDGSLDVLFVDYGNIDTVKIPFFVKNTSMIEETGEEIFLDVNIDMHVDEDIAGDKNSDKDVAINKEFPTTSNSPSHFSLPITSSNTPVEVNGEFIYPDVENKAFPCSKIEKTEDISLTKTSDGSTFSGRSLPIISVKRTKVKPFNILKHLTISKVGSKEMVIECVLKVSENISSPIGMTVLLNKSVVIGSSADDSAKILRPDGTLLTPINSVRQFVKPTDMTTLSTGEFVIRDDMGLQLFTEDGLYIKSFATKQIDKCFGLAEDEDGNIITINWAQPSTNSKPGTKGNGGLTSVGETDVFFISRKSGEVLKRIELTDIISDKTKSKCRFLRYHNNTLYIVDIGLDWIYKLKTDCNEVSRIGGTGTGSSKFRDPSGIVVDDFGNFIVADSKNHRLQIFDRDEKFVGFVVLDFPIRRPSGIFLDKEQGELYVLNYWGIYAMVKYRASCSRV